MNWYDDNNTSSRGHGYEAWATSTGPVVYITVSPAMTAASGIPHAVPGSHAESMFWAELRALAAARAAAASEAGRQAEDDRRVHKRAPPVAFEWGEYMHPVRPAKGRGRADALPPTPRGPGPYTRRGAPVTTNRYGRVTLAGSTGRAEWGRAKGRQKHRRRR